MEWGRIENKWCQAPFILFLTFTKYFDILNGARHHLFLDKIDFFLENPEKDVLGDAYEYLIGQFASGAGKKAGEFYMHQEVR